ncbi:hypothetical protein TSUD_247910 [Trifolium subterraneum]|uniref:Reverse transcriptase zinc-binding domain-containing protein n=1 Tax=Trifolium subterraneum TaxID=3900 RepID=A0A2Z6PCM3_TRISU|nr:hypothetical protein TSUD_247910 [Trifolium subterraneum]
MLIFYLSFLKTPVKVWKQIVRLQRNLLWGGAGQDRKIAWVSWENICGPKNRGGLGIRDIRAVNLALLGKWRWRVITGGWKRELSVAEFDLLQDLLHVVTQSPLLEMEDSWVWTLDPTSSYSVKSAYLAITSVEAAPEQNSILTRVWKFWAPSKVIVLSWKLLQDRVPIRQNILRRRVFREASMSFCALCGDFVESVDHLFITCDCISKFWNNIARWLGFELVSPNNISNLFEWFLGLGMGRKSRLGWLLIWHAAVWSIWISRNDLIFDRGTISIESLVDKVKLSS